MALYSKFFKVNIYLILFLVGKQSVNIPKRVASQIVKSLINIVLVAEIFKGILFKKSNPIVPASVAPSPPGRKDNAPIIVAAK